MTSPTQSAMEQQQRGEPMQTEREAFEAWAKREGWHDFSRNERHPIYYEQSGLQSSWAAWQAQASELRSLRDSLALARSHIGELREALEKVAFVQVAAGHGYDLDAMDEAIVSARAALNKEQP